MNVGRAHIVMPGESLEGIAQRYYGNKDKWPVIYDHNNISQIKFRTSMHMGIPSPHSLIVGQTIFIPDIRTAAGQQGKVSLSARAIITNPQKCEPEYLFARPNIPAKMLDPIKYEYSLEQIPPVKVESLEFTVTIKFSGTVSLQNTKNINFITLTKNNFAMECKQKADMAMGALITNVKFEFDLQTRKPKFSSELTTKMGYPGGIETAVSMSANPLPVYKITLTFPNKAGVIIPEPSLGSYKCEVGDFKVTVEITTRPPVVKPGLEKVTYQEPITIKGRGDLVLNFNDMLYLTGLAICTGFMTKIPALAGYIKAMSMEPGVVLGSTSSIMLNGKISITGSRT